LEYSKAVNIPDRVSLSAYEVLPTLIIVFLTGFLTRKKISEEQKAEEIEKKLVAKKNRKLPYLPLVFAGFYLAWGIICILLGINDPLDPKSWTWASASWMSYWPIDSLHRYFADVLFSIFGYSSDDLYFFLISDLGRGLFYIVFGVLWGWFLGKIISMAYTYISELRSTNKT